ncbi:MAG TPA: hypothetical protein VGU73_07860 [Acidimicrobiia bacterium]|nr:hypothetical protein [Acidimicrobiia bacterium]
MFEYLPAFIQVAGPPPVVPATVDDLAKLGVHTLYLQATIDDPRAAGLIADPPRLAQMLRRAHADGLRVVAWYYPQLADPVRDAARLDAILAFRASGEHFDGIALDIESAQVPTIADRNQRLVALARHVRAQAATLPVGAIVYPAVLLEVVNPNLWPDFPYQALAPSVDVWLPETYWTLRSGPYRDAFAYTDQSVTRLRADLHDPHAKVAPIGGEAGSSTPIDIYEYGLAVKKDGAIGRSIYDVTGTATSDWPYLRQ